MRLLLLASAATTLLGGAAIAQSLLGQSQPGQGAVAVPAAPPVMAAPSTPVPVPAPAPPAPPGLVQTPLPPPDVDNGTGAAPSGTNTDNGGGQTTQMQAVSPSAPAPADNGGSAPPAPASSGAAPSQPAPPDLPPPPPNDWVPGKAAVLGVLNKVDGSTSTVTIPVGGQATVGDLTVSVQACMSRPPGELPDSAIFLTLTPKNTQDGGQVYRGWMVHSTPGATDAGNAGEAFRVITCS